MKTLTYTIESQQPIYIQSLSKLLNKAIEFGSNNLDETLRNIDNALWFNGWQLKCGRGGNHIWVSNQANERIAIIY
jgi:hypothetical protein